MKSTVVVILALIFTSVFASGDHEGFVRLMPDDLNWQELSPGLSFAVIEGDPGQEGFYIIRAKFAPGTLSAPHYHPNDRFVTVISGTWWTGTGPVQDDDKMVPLSPGSYMKHPARAVHYDGSRDEEVIVQIAGVGPAPLVYVDGAGKPLR